MQVPFLDLKAINESLREELDQCYQEVLNQSCFVFGKQVNDFERAFAQKCGVDHCVGVGNCTDALYIALKMLGINPGDEVLIPAMTWITDAAVVTQLGATPVFVDVDDQGLMNLDLVESHISPQTKAIIPVHLYGQMVDMPRLMNLASGYNLKVIEDCAQAHFATINGQVAGSYGDAAVFSFYPTKNLGAIGDAGCIVTNDEDLALACRKYANHGGVGKNNHEFVGVNSRMDTLQAAVLLLKLNYIDQWNAERHKIASRYNSALSGIGDLLLPNAGHEGGHVFHIFAIQTERRDALMVFLEERGIQTQIHYPKAVPFTAAYSNMNLQMSDFPNAHRMQEQCLSLPIYPGLSVEKQECVISSIEMFYRDA